MPRLDFTVSKARDQSKSFQFQVHESPKGRVTLLAQLQSIAPPRGFCRLVMETVQNDV